ncbi:tyrosine-type recombinase/integrase [Paraburkholderia sediminicola]
MKRFDRPFIGHLSRDEIEALLAAPDPNTWCGQGDRVLLATLYNTGARVSELIRLRVGDVVLDKTPCAHSTAKAGNSAPYRCGAQPRAKSEAGCRGSGHRLIRFCFRIARGIR